MSVGSWAITIAGCTAVGICLCMLLEHGSEVKGPVKKNYFRVGFYLATPSPRFKDVLFFILLHTPKGGIRIEEEQIISRLYFLGQFNVSGIEKIHIAK